MAGNRKVLITGASGLIGGVLRAALSERFELTGVDRRAVPDLPSLTADMRDLDAILPAFEGVDTVVDLAAYAPFEAPWETIRDNNIPATYNSLEAARRAGARRLVFASSNHVTGMYENDHPYSAIVAGSYDGLDSSAIPYLTTAMPIRPDGPYGIGKAFGEAAGRYYSDTQGLSVICMRIGTVIVEDRPLNQRHFATLLTHDDLARLVGDCVEASEDVRFAIFYGVSNNKWRFWDIENSRRLIGYEPMDNAEAWRAG